MCWLRFAVCVCVCVCECVQLVSRVYSCLFSRCECVRAVVVVIVMLTFLIVRQSIRFSIDILASSLPACLPPHSSLPASPPLSISLCRRRCLTLICSITRNLQVLRGSLSLCCCLCLCLCLCCRCLPGWECACLSVCMCVCLFVCIALRVWQSLCLPACLSVCLYCVSFCFSHSPYSLMFLYVLRLFWFLNLFTIIDGN